jgi:alkylated DNA repair protein alkB homolog 1
VPRILEDTSPAHFISSWSDENDTQGGKEDDWKPYAAYIQSARINVNVRQVFPRGFDPKAHLSV